MKMGKKPLDPVTNFIVQIWNIVVKQQTRKRNEKVVGLYMSLEFKPALKQWTNRGINVVCTTV